MALPYTVAQFLDAARKRTDNEGISASDRFPDLEWITYLNRAVWRFWRIMVESRAGNWHVSTTNVSTIPGSSIYALDARFYRLLNVNATIDNRKQWIVPFDENERAALSDANVGWSGRPFRYSLVEDNIEFLPTPTAVYTIELRFVPDPPTLIAGGSFDCANGDGVNYIIDEMSLLAAEKDENFELANTLRGSIAQLKAALETSLPNRDQNFPPRIQNVQSARGGPGGLRSRSRWGR